ncbi:MAG: MurR/RpiR family transcriptional regulator [Clostridia bacterium]|nr:MurR/RpiR family transcriptional regulator [Clostridia bacterium]MBQ7091066.1 MurR/RpiR family transcriptional regulator [Clostridia bacterium]
MESTDLLARINANYNSFSKGQKLLANYIVDNYDRAAFITASRMGRTVGVSESTVVRFAYALGYDGYPELQRSLQEMIRNRLTTVQRIQLTSDLEQDEVLSTVLKADIGNIRSTIESVDTGVFNTVIDNMLNARRVYLVGIKSAAPLAQFFGYYLNFILEDVMIVTSMQSDVYESMLRIGEGDMCIGISFPRYSSRTVDALKFAKDRGAYVAALTDSMFSPIAELADSVLIARSDMASFADSLVAPLSLINAIIVGAGLRRKTAVSECLNQLEGIWKSQKVYIGSKSEGIDD